MEIEWCGEGIKVGSICKIFTKDELFLVGGAYDAYDAERGERCQIRMIGYIPIYWASELAIFIKMVWIGGWYLV